MQEKKSSYLCQPSLWYKNWELVRWFGVAPYPPTGVKRILAFTGQAASLHKLRMWAYAMHLMPASKQGIFQGCSPYFKTHCQWEMGLPVKYLFGSRVKKSPSYGEVGHEVPLLAIQSSWIIKLQVQEETVLKTSDVGHCSLHTWTDTYTHTCIHMWICSYNRHTLFPSFIHYILFLYNII